MNAVALKDSGYPWLGEIPEHWETVPVKWLFRNRNERARENDVHLTASQQLGILPQTEFMAIKNQQVVLTLVGGENMKHIEPDDFLIHLRSFQGGIEWSANRGKVSPAYTVLTPGADVHPRYFYYLLKSDGYVRQLSTTTNQLRDGQSMTFDQFAMIPLPRIPLGEQRAIADYLDRETAQIDALIAKQERLVDVLDERRSAMITYAVTCGLNPDAPMKASGVEWLGDMPEHWDVPKLKYMLASVDQGISPQASPELADAESWGVVKSGCVNRGVFSDLQHKRLPEGFDFDLAVAITPGDLLVCRASGSPSLVGSAAIVRQLRYRLILSDKTFRLNVKPAHAPEYLERVMNSRLYREQVTRSISGAEGLANNLPLSALKNFLFPMPPLAEQKKIVSHLDHETGKIGALIDKAKKVNAVLRERRSALISAAVTGKIDVTNRIEGTA